MLVGNHKIEFDTSIYDLGSGLYFAFLKGETKILTKKLILLR